MFTFSIRVFVCSYEEKASVDLKDYDEVSFFMYLALYSRL